MSETENVDLIFKKIMESEELKTKLYKFVKDEIEEEEEENNHDGGITKIFKTLFKIFIIDVNVVRACSGWKDKTVYILSSAGMRIVMLWQLPEIIRAFLGA